MSSKFANLTTERLFLRELQAGDAEEIFRLRSDERVNQFVDRARAVTIDDAHNFIQMIQRNSANDEGLFWALTLIGEAKLIGTIVYWHIEWENCKAEIGYEMLPEYQGQGLMSEALKKVIEFGFEELKFREITAEPNERNVKSIRLLEKLGFDLTGTDGDYLIYSLSSVS
ncbi:MAG TPA: GNAT family N-acetyltransferase [Mucilaginibacter sp.]|jgi:ribosomal-protein-alanine N-acetyltransferase|nr:GNAT family N-acetyltransferase [Mucilaginibacter sp.]